MTTTELVDSAPTVDAAAFRSVMSTVCSQVVVATTAAHGRAHGTTITAFASMSLDPPLVAISLDRNSLLLAQVRHSGQFGVNVLSHEQQDVALACSGKEAGKFDRIAWTETDGLPRIDGSVGWLACTLWDEFVTGDHVLLVGLVRGADAAGESTPPLVYARRTFGTHSGHVTA